MDQLAKLQKEVEDIRKLLHRKQEELDRFKNEKSTKQNDDHKLNHVGTGSTKSLTDLKTSTCWTNTLAMNLASKESFNKTCNSTGCNGTQTEQCQCNSSTTVHHTGSFDGHQTDAGSEERSKAYIGSALPRWAIERYSRQILLPEIGVGGQERLCSARVLIVGAGGLGCPAGVYLAGAGVGEIGIVDYDTVDLTNVHRQFLHGEKDQLNSKAESAADSLRSINSRIKVTPHNVQLNSQNALQIASQYDIVLDCTDNVPTRYLLNDLCVLTKLPLISGSALKMEGQLTVYGYRAKENNHEKEYIGPCYRCVFPAPPPAEAVGSCSANGVAGPVPGVIGALQALEAIKYIVGQQHSKLLVERMLLFDGEDTTFRTVKLRPRNPNCAVCSDTPSISQLIDYELFCKAQAKEKDLDLQILPPEHRLSPLELSRRLSNCEQRHLLVDVRNEAEFNMCRIDGSVNYPIEKLHGGSFERLLGEIRNGRNSVTFLCRRGNDSQIVAKKVLEAVEKEHRGEVNDLRGGLHAWSSDIDKDFPIY